MHILSIGLNHASASVELRERLAFSEEQVRASLARLTCGNISSPLSEMVILSTCNRIEIYCACNTRSFDELEAFLSDAQRRTGRSKFSRMLYHLEDMDAVHHLFDVAAGLNSLVVGEPQILGQVTRPSNWHADKTQQVPSESSFPGCDSRRQAYSHRDSHQP